MFIYFDHAHDGRPCFRHDCERPEYTDCHHPPAKSVVNGQVRYVDGIVHDECRSCAHKVSEAVSGILHQMTRKDEGNDE